eukprot:UN10194
MIQIIFSLFLGATLVIGSTSGSRLIGEVEERRRLQDLNGEIIKSKYDTDKCVDVRTDDAETVYGGTCHGAVNQRWTYIPSTQQIQAFNDECLDVDYNGNNDVKALTCHDGNSQKWILAGDIIISRWNSYCLDYNPSNANVYVYHCHGESNQRWYY